MDNISFSTIHVYPDNWGIPADNFEWIISNFILDRAAIAHNHSKPLIMEEFGMKKGYLSTRDILLQEYALPGKHFQQTKHFLTQLIPLFLLDSTLWSAALDLLLLMPGLEA